MRNAAGTWERVGNYHFVVTINNVAFNGVIVPQYNSDLGYAELSFTGVSPDGVSMWANKIAGTGTTSIAERERVVRY
ncbi:MAG: hypothetical protein LBU70_02305 [Chitinispirillales bacterium]|jgi:hypothetical protein|nr:hypothetical protein [Chitinispirillales bacterium]